MDLNKLTEAEKAAIRKSPEYRAAMADTLLWKHKRDMADLASKKILEQVRSGKA